MPLEIPPWSFQRAFYSSPLCLVCWILWGLTIGFLLWRSSSSSGRIRLAGYAVLSSILGVFSALLNFLYHQRRDVDVIVDRGLGDIVVWVDSELTRIDSTIALLSGSVAFIIIAGIVLLRRLSIITLDRIDSTSMRGKSKGEQISSGNS